MKKIFIIICLSLILLPSVFAATGFGPMRFYYVLVNSNITSGINEIHFSSNQDDSISGQKDFALKPSKSTQYYLMVHSTSQGNYNLTFTFYPLCDSNTKAYAPYDVWIDSGIPGRQSFTLTTTEPKQITVPISSENYTAGSFDNAYAINYSFGDALEGTYTSDVKVIMEAQP